MKDNYAKIHRYPPLAQLDRVPDSDSVGRRFESCKAGQKKRLVIASRFSSFGLEVHMYLFWLIPLIIIASILLFSFVCFMIVFYSPKRKPLGEDEYEIPKGEIYEVYRDYMVEWAKKSRSMPHEDISITSNDGLTLRGRYYEYSKDAVVEILFHGYRGDGERDLSGAIDRCFQLGRSCLIVDQRGSGRSDGHVITFGVKERYDCLKWVEYCIMRFGKDVRIIITGVSMGAATVTMASGLVLPDNVIGVLADCGYTSPNDIICKVLKDLKLPIWLFYPMIRLGALLYGRFDIESASPVESIKNCKIPMLIFHGDKDDFVPICMSEKLYKACGSDKKHFKVIKGAGHGLAFPVDREGYLDTVRRTSAEWGI